MCCVLAVLVLLGPRAGIVVWGLADPARWNAAFGSFVLPLLGFLFLPWTTLMFVLVAPRGTVAGLGWVGLAVAVLADLSSYGAADRRRRAPVAYRDG